MKLRTAQEILSRLVLCPEGRDWLLQKNRSPDEIWSECPRADWLVWYAIRCRASLEKLQELAIRVAMLAYDEADFQAWAKSWIDGTDRSPQKALDAGDGVWAIAHTYEPAATKRYSAQAAIHAARLVSDDWVDVIFCLDGVMGNAVAACIPQSSMLEIVHEVLDSDIERDVTK